MIRDAARDFAQTELLPGVIERDEKQEFPAEQIKKLDYRTHKKSFTRNEDEIRLKHFVLPTKNEAVKLKKLLKSNKKGALLEEYIYKYKPETKTVKKNLIVDNLIGFVFNHMVGDVVGPKKMGSSYHVFEILRKNKKGTIKGLEVVYDEIQHRLFADRLPIGAGRAGRRAATSFIRTLSTALSARKAICRTKPP